MNLESQIEAILFYKGEPVSLRILGGLLNVSPAELLQAISNLKASLTGRGIVLQENNEEITLGTAPEYSELIEKLRKEELSRDLSKATLETLSIILYKNGASRAEIDYIRGVNSSFTLRALSVRGLVEKTTDKEDSRRYIYKPSFDLLSYMGVASVQDLPDYDEVNKSIEASAKALEEELKSETIESSTPNEQENAN